MTAEGHPPAPEPTATKQAAPGPMAGAVASVGGQSQTSPIRLGDLLTGAGLLRPEDLRQAMLIAKSQNLPVGRVLIMSGFILEQHLQAAVHAQSMLKDGLLDFETALGGLRTISRDNISFDEALNRMGWKAHSQQPTNKLGELLIESQIINTQQLDLALQQGQTSGLPLGRVLVVNGMISEQLLASVLNAQILIRDKRITREQAISSLKAAKERHIPIEQTLGDSGLASSSGESVRLGELLVMAHLLNEDKLMQAVELGLVNEQPIGQVLVQNNLVSEQCLQSALTIQNLVSQGKLRKALSGQVLELVAREKISVEAAVERIQPSPQQVTNNLPLYQFLQLAGIIGPKDIEEALKAGSRNSQLMGQMLLMTSCIDRNLLVTALKCSDLMSQGVLKTDQAVIALGICWKSKNTLEDAFKQLGWNQNILKACQTSPATDFFAASTTQSRLPVQPGPVVSQAHLPLQAPGPATSQPHLPQQTAQMVSQPHPPQQTAEQSHMVTPGVPPHPPATNQAAPARKPDSRNVASTTMANLPALTPNQSLTVSSNTPTPTSTGEMPPIQNADQGTSGSHQAAPGNPTPLRKRLSDLVPKPPGT